MKPTQLFRKKLGALLKQLHHGPIGNAIISVIAYGTGNQMHDAINNYGTIKKDKVSPPFIVDDKVNVFFKARFEGLNRDNSRLITYVSLQKRQSVHNCNVEITCQEFRKVITCSEEWIDIQLNPIESKNALGGWEESINAMLLLFIIEVNITVHEISMSNYTQLYEDTEFTDFQLKAADGSVAVHKLILAFQSDVFKIMLKGEWKETVEGCINIDGVTKESLQHLKDYMYLGTLPDEGLEPLILLAEHYLMDKLKSDCINKLVKSVKPENFGRIIQFAYQSGLSEELMLALICGIPNDVANSLKEFKKKCQKKNIQKKTESNDEN